MTQRKAYAGDGITVHFEPARCIHAAECVGGLPEVFDPKRRPWILAGAASADDIVDVVHRCPSGALSYERTDGGPAEATRGVPPVITTVADGPLHVRGMVDVVGPDGDTICVGPRLALCRCGHSKNKPFCDNSHVAADFRTDR